jgi:hypothetical protein
MSNTPLGDSALELIKIQSENLHYLMQQAYETIERVKQLHNPVVSNKEIVCSECLADGGMESMFYPCATIRAINGQRI